MVNQVYVALGSNMGVREQFLKEAVYDLHAIPETKVVRSSSIYETEPVGYTNQAQFLNMVVEVQTSLSPADLLKETAFIEQRHHRKRDVRWGPRTLDIDILLYNMENIKTNELEIPHPRMTQRMFVLRPLHDLLPGSFLIPDETATLSELIRHCPDKEGIYVWKHNAGGGAFALFES
ncbi:2-amino-4-hydroxy-6-hydroxymethyldihydropteridine diphosphokinase [Bacillaceae bacterium SIJ1]|uniref:2-amino-4-hydroxy-6- hydroxymethyldihydropteridine diphosphokinase n=1 Tax=Litoribacterium kuwaitense TaxID=1398745 RepID=UPI0013E9EBFC|nr:2-amino-4-hydroxy-6-hydroxymethyldihydropteridine diphosphokinase [Litoribacterium kuwaitense]NGP46883.1 2-amino-4-hydroxy-6-hydroxymethyldihydropteridine diphosphokinase [Litoribacterium kuwaitense]